jgi:hypothetical protein
VIEISGVLMPHSVLALTTVFCCNSGDFTRGVVASAKGATKSGAQMRGGNAYQFGDFTAGTANAAGDYASENRGRLAGVGGSAAGMIAGTALLGPIGFVAGSFLGSSAAQSSMRALSGDSKSGQRAGGDSIMQGNESQNQAPDLLSPNDNGSNPSPPTLSNPSGITPHVQAMNAEARLIGEIATSDHRAVMVQARVVDDPLNSNSLRYGNRPADEGHAQAMPNSISVSTAQIHPRSLPTSMNPNVAVEPSNGNRRQTAQAQAANAPAALAPAASAYPLAIATPLHSHHPVAYIPNSRRQTPELEREVTQNTSLGRAYGNPVQNAHLGGVSEPQTQFHHGQRNQSNSHTRQPASNLGNQSSTGQEEDYHFGKFEGNPRYGFTETLADTVIPMIP